MDRLQGATDSKAHERAYPEQTGDRCAGIGAEEKKVIYRILNFISCTAMLSQKPSMANLEAV